MQIFFATRNKGKVAEIGHLLEGSDIEISSLLDRPDIPDVAEDGATFLDNARKKARETARGMNSWVLADDSGLVIPALGGEPGVLSARYAGFEGNYSANNEKLLLAMNDIPDGKRSAAFVCAMVLISPDGREWDVEGRCEGVIGRKLKGTGGFGYDPLFFVPSEGKTMAELPMDRKNELSHRGKALRKIKEILVAIAGKDR